jgi:hypothetical protein
MLCEEVTYRPTRHLYLRSVVDWERSPGAAELRATRPARLELAMS